MPFKSKAQMKYLWANHPEVAAEFAKETKNFKDLPERVKEAMVDIYPCFQKIAKSMFNPNETPVVPHRVIQQKNIQAAKDKKMGGMSPVQYRNEMTSRRTGIVGRNKQSMKPV